MMVFADAKEIVGAKVSAALVAPSIVRAFLREIFVMIVPAKGRKGSLI